MEISLSPHLTEIVPNLKIGIIQYDNIIVDESPQMLRGRMQTFQESLFFDFEDKSVAEIHGVSEWRTIFKQVGTDPNRYRPSIEALYRRIKKQNYLHSVHSAVDLNNFFSLKYEVPIGIYDANKISGKVEIIIGSTIDEYTGINGRVISMEKKILSSDENGAFGSPYIDSERTAVTKDTVKALQIVYLKPSLSIEENKKLVESLGNMYTQIHGGTANVSILS